MTRHLRICTDTGSITSPCRCFLLLFSMILCMTVMPSALYAQLRLSFVGGTAMDGSSYPKLSIQVRATLNNAPYLLTTANVLIQENVTVSTPRSVSAPQANGAQIIEWDTRNKNNYNTKATIYAFTDTQVVSLNSDSAYALGIDSRVPQIRWRRSDGARIEELDMGTVAAGGDQSVSIECLAVSGRFRPDKNELPIRVDSIRTQTPYFEAKWIGGFNNYNQPPTNIYSPFGYKVEVHFKPPDNNYHYDVLTVYYEGGAVEHLQLKGNVFALPQTTVLNLITPNGGEILAPCSTVPITWKGAAKGFPCVIEYSTDNGQIWKEITRTTDSSYVWTIPDTPSDNVLLRVKQVIEDNSDFELNEGNERPVDKLAYNPDGTTFLAAYRNSTLVEWNPVNLRSVRRYYLRDAADSAENAVVYGAEYLAPDRFFVVYRSTSSASKNDTIAFYTTGTATPVSVVPLPTDAHYTQAYLDSSLTNIVLLPRQGTVITLISAADGSLVRTIPCPSPITALSIGRDKAIVALLDGRIQLYTLPSWTLSQTLQLTGIPLIQKILLMPDNQRIAIGCRVSTASQIDGSVAEQYIVDIASQQIIRSRRKAATSPITVTANPTSRYVLMGFPAQPQGELWDIATNSMAGTVVSHSGAVSDIVFSPDGKTIVSSAGSADNLRLRRFIYPEVDQSDGTMRIVRATMNAVTASIDSIYAYTGKDTTLTLNLCNNGIVPVVVGGSWWITGGAGSSFQVINSLSPDTLQPGGCLHIPLRFAPRDTGLVKDVFNVYMCSTVFSLPLEGYARPRNLSAPDTVDFGDVCTGQSIEKEIVLLRNNDPAILAVNSLTIPNSPNSSFSIVQRLSGDTLSEKGEMRVRLKFLPKQLGENVDELLIYYGNQKKLFTRIVLRGRGAGADIQASAQPIAFIPEEKSRTVVLRNKNNNPVIISSLSVNPANGFSLDAVSVPLTINAGDSLTLTLRWNSVDSTHAELVATIEPCGAPLHIPILLYKASSDVYVETIQADPSGEAIIPVKFNTKENYSYSGVRTFTAEFSVNPRMFLPTTVTSEFGSAKLIRNEIINDKRIVGISVSGNFPTTGTVANVRGYAGLAETDRSPIEFNKQSLFWSTAVPTTAQDGVLQLINLCGDRRIIQNATLSIASVAPNPIRDEAELNIISDDQRRVNCQVFSQTGERVLSSDMDVQKGSSTQRLSLSSLPGGVYTLVLRSDNLTASTLVLIVR